jgi:folate-binding Fe-S cluster repair protein YgfZ
MRLFSGTVFSHFRGGAFSPYRGRWQIELVFKRLKSLLEAGHVPKSDDASAKAWMQAKILSALPVDRVLLEEKFFPRRISA